MSTTTTAVPQPLPAVLDLSGTSRVPFTRLVRVEVRKMVDTRAGLWLLLTIGIVTVAATLVFGLVAADDDKTMVSFMGFAASPQGFLLPILGILLVTQEWGQRTAMVTFTQEPHRGRVIAAKVAAALVLGTAAIVLAITFALLATVVFGDAGSIGDLDVLDYVQYVLLQYSGLLQGLAFGLLFLASAAAIVSFFVIPSVFSIVANVWPALSDKAVWLDLGTAQTPLYEAGDLTGEQWAQVAVTTGIWVVLPFLAGLWRVMRAEIK